MHWLGAEELIGPHKQLHPKSNDTVGAHDKKAGKSLYCQLKFLVLLNYFFKVRIQSDLIKLFPSLYSVFPHSGGTTVKPDYPVETNMELL